MLDASAGNGKASFAKAGKDKKGYLIGGRQQVFPKGDYRVTFRLKARRTPEGKAVTRINILGRRPTGEKKTLIDKELHNKDFSSPDTYQDINLSYSLEKPQRAEFRLYFTGAADLWCDYVYVLCDGEEDPRFRYAAEQLYYRAGMVVLYTGNFEGYQGVELLIESIPVVMAKHVRVRFVLAGGEEAQIARMQNLAGSLKVDGFTVFAGKRPLREMPVFMEIADILVSPRVEGTNTPLKIFTYLQSGKPVVATRLLTHTQVLTDDVAILTEAEPDAFGAGILKLLENEGLRGELGNRCKRLVEEKYSEEKFAEKVREVYEYLSRHSKHS